jgi:hypothetical protein
VEEGRGRGTPRRREKRTRTDDVEEGRGKTGVESKNVSFYPLPLPFFMAVRPFVRPAVDCLQAKGQCRGLPHPRRSDSPLRDARGGLADLVVEIRRLVPSPDVRNGVESGPASQRGLRVALRQQRNSDKHPDRVRFAP